MQASSTARRLFGPRIQLWLGVLLGLIMLFLAGRGLDLALVGQTLARVNPMYVLLALLVFLLTQVVKAVRWRWLLSPKPTGLTLMQLANLLIVGQTINLLFLTRLGDIARAYLTGEESGASKTYVLGSIAAEKVVDLLALAIVIMCLIPFITLPAWLAARQVPVIAVAAALVLAMACLIAGRHTWIAWLNRLLARIPGSSRVRWQARLAAGLDGLSAVANRRAALAIWWWTLVIWSLGALTNMFLFLAFNLPARVLPAVFLLAVLQAGVAVPSVPGKIGVFHYLCVLALSAFGVPAAVALGYGITLHLIVVGSNSVWSAIAMWQYSWHLRQFTVLET
jgi:glycosyltransferase 2 family protein